MNYSQFVNAVKKMGTGFPIPTLGKESHFYVQIKDSCIVYRARRFDVNVPNV